MTVQEDVLASLDLEIAIEFLHLPRRFVVAVAVVLEVLGDDLLLHLRVFVHLNLLQERLGTRRSERADEHPPECTKYQQACDGNETGLPVNWPPFLAQLLLPRRGPDRPDRPSVVIVFDSLGAPGPSRRLVRARAHLGRDLVLDLL